MRQHALTAIILFATVIAVTAQPAQKPEPSPPPQNPSTSPTIPLRVQLVISSTRETKR